MTTIVAPPCNASKWQMGFNSAFKGLNVNTSQYNKKNHEFCICFVLRPTYAQLSHSFLDTCAYVGHSTKYKMRSTFISIIEAQQAKIYNNYKNTKLKLLKMNAAIWFNKMCNWVW